MPMVIPGDLLQGYREFRRSRYAHEAERYRQLAREQKPRTMIIGCADSRVDPASIFSAAPGELFVVRNVAALVPPCENEGAYHGTSAALEFAVAGLSVSNIVVLGHGMCGGISAALAAADSRPVGSFINPWVELLSEARDEVISRIDASHPETRQRTLERLAIKTSLANLATFPFVEAALTAGRLSLHGAWFSIADGEMHWLDKDADVFESVPES